ERAARGFRGAADGFGGPVDLAVRQEQAARGPHHEQAQHHGNHQFDQPETSLRRFRRDRKVLHNWLVMSISTGSLGPLVARSSLHCTPTLHVIWSARQTTRPLASGATVVFNPSSQPFMVPSWPVPSPST